MYSLYEVCFNVWLWQFALFNDWGVIFLSVNSHIEHTQYYV